MSRTVVVELFKYEELSEYSKQQARRELSEGWAMDPDNSEEDILELCEEYGIEFREQGYIY